MTIRRLLRNYQTDIKKNVFFYPGRSAPKRWTHHKIKCIFKCQPKQNNFWNCLSRCSLEPGADKIKCMDSTESYFPLAVTDNFSWLVSRWSIRQLSQSLNPWILKKKKKHWMLCIYSRSSNHLMRCTSDGFFDDLMESNFAHWFIDFIITSQLITVQLFLQRNFVNLVYYILWLFFIFQYFHKPYFFLSLFIV